MKAAVIVFPGSNRDGDVARALRQAGARVTMVWHGEAKLPRGTDLAVLPGGFSYGDYLRCGAIAGRAAIMGAVRRHAERGGLVLGICNGFQILCEAGLLPGALLRNDSLQFRCMPVHLRTETVRAPFTSRCAPGQVLRVPISHGEGRYHADPETLAQLVAEDRIVFRYCTPEGDVTQEANPNGSVENIAGIVNAGRNVLGMMPHPERASETLVGGEDGLAIWQSMVEAAAPAIVRR